MYEVAILLSDRPKDLATQMENGNYRVLLEQKVCGRFDALPRVYRFVLISFVV